MFEIDIVNFLGFVISPHGIEIEKSHITIILKWPKFIYIKNVQIFLSFTNTLILFVFKKNESLWLCINYRKLNLITIKNCYLLSLINKILNQLVSASIFMQLNLWNAYHHVCIKKSDEWKITFHMQYEHYEYQVLLFKLTNVPVMFQVYINKTLSSLLDICCIIYLNDILIYSNSRLKHHYHVHVMLE